MKPTLLYFIAFTLILTACSAPAPAAAAQTPANLEAVASQAVPPEEIAPSTGVFQSPAGELEYVSSRFVSEVNGVKPAPGCKLLLVVVQRTDGERIDLEKFSNPHQEIIILGDDGSQTLSTMGGFVGPDYKEFAVGFQLPEAVKTFTLLWGDNTPFEITPDG